MYCDACYAKITPETSNLVYIKQDNRKHRLVTLCDKCYKEYNTLNLVLHTSNQMKGYIYGQK